MDVDRSSPSVVPFGAEAGERAPGLGDKFVDNEEAVPAQLHKPLATLELLLRHHLAALTEDGLPRRAAPQNTHTHKDITGDKTNAVHLTSFITLAVPPDCEALRTVRELRGQGVLMSLLFSLNSLGF